MKKMPKDRGIDHTLNLLKEGYHFIINRSESLNTNIFKTNLLGKKVYCLIGSTGAELFYDDELFKRDNAAPSRIKKTLFGQNGVQGLDGEAHQKRKSMFMKLMDDNAMKKIGILTDKYWNIYFNNTTSLKNISMYQASKKVFLQTACEWTGVPLKKDEIDKRVVQLAKLFEHAASIGLKHWQARSARTSANKWIEEIVRKVRSRNLDIKKDRALYKFAWFRDINGELLEDKVVAVEILNILRPMVAVSVWVANLGLAMHQFPEEARKLQNNNDKDIEMFLQETRRYYPFFPFAIANVKKDFEYDGYKFKKDTLTLLDLYGTNRYQEDWSQPEAFIPKRFKDWENSPFSFIPQGGGNYDFGHRCAGEFITIVLMKTTVQYLINNITYEVPEQNFKFNFNDIPAIPSDGFVISNIQFYKPQF
ncbi:cytochrome P450 [Staphylococcus pseudoxylosus]|uniref:cytochrome P450 n=1 Tax=Staphylococcus pseudoxylosus TaxID=2282419 RepID=UPI00193A0150|nr:cytochrome P450 [Staphylococcus pseudoxylosus]MBM2659765.1 cytochrome P450 [Staphylococcus pseudoxylosus]